MNTCDQLTARQIEQLHVLYQNENWSKGRTLEETRRGVEGSTLCIAMTDEEDGLAAFCRILSDGIFKALVFDVIVDEKYRGEGLGDQLVALAQSHPALAHVKHLELYCLPELEPFYARHGFSTEVNNMRLMRRINHTA
jgi:predicted GNAT family N-acyltransferase